MVNLVQTVVCPNCGASAHNFHNCEYCGSFLVQKASEGVDLRAYVEHSANYANPVIEGLIDRVFKIVGMIPSDGLGEINLCFDFPKGNSLGVVSWAGGVSSEVPGVSLFINSQTLDRYGCMLKFMQSPSFPLFSMIKDDWQNEDGTTSDRYVVHFGMDIKGATKLLSQVIQEVYGVDLKNVVYTIETISDISFGGASTEVYNSNGVCIEKTGGAAYDYRPPKEYQDKFLAEHGGSADENKKTIVLSVVAVIAFIVFIILMFVFY